TPVSAKPGRSLERTVSVSDSVSGTLKRAVCPARCQVFLGICGEPARSRTENQQIKSLLLCQLSYGPTLECEVGSAKCQVTLVPGRGERPRTAPRLSPAGRAHRRRAVSAK